MIATIHELSATCRTRLRLAVGGLHLALVLCGVTSASAAPPDLTTGGVPDNTDTINLGPTGLRGWVYDTNAARTGESRQIKITAVDAGSPAAGILAANDVILGADGSGASPIAFSADARKSLALAIAAAEARATPTLQLLRWRAGTTDTVQLTLRTMGAYSATAPYNCPKSAMILAEGAQYAFAQQTAGRYSFGTLALLAAGNPAHQAKVQTDARALIPSAATMAAMKSNVRDTASTWERGHVLIVLTEYYLATNDAMVLPAIEAYAVNIAKNQSLFGTVGHIYAEKTASGGNNGPMGGVYGVVNSTGMPCFLGLLLAKECGLTNPEIAPAIERTSRFFAYYTGKGAIPYGEHEPYYQAHESNGKCGLSSLAFSLQANRIAEGKFFAKMATASADERENGHTGAFFNYLWAPLGANSGGEAAAAAFFSKVSWHYDLARRWNGAFVYDNLNGEGPVNGSEYNDFRMSTVALLTYAMPLRRLHITGRNQNPARLLSPTDVTAAVAANDYTPTSRSLTQLVSDLGNWSPRVRNKASDELKIRSGTGALVSQLTTQANDPIGTSRVGACLALGKIVDSGSANARAVTLAALLTDADNSVRFYAGEALRQLGSARTPVVNTILAAAASTARPLVPFIEEDPLQFAHSKTAMLLFYSGNAYGPKGVLYNSITGIDRNLLYPAIRAVAATPTGLARSTLYSTYSLLTKNDTIAVAEAIVDSVQYRAPADKMFTSGVRQGGLAVLQKYGFAEGVPLSKIFMIDDVRDSEKPAALNVLKSYAGGITTVVPDPGVIEYLESLLRGSQGANAQAVLTAIANDPNPAPLTPLKSIQSVIPDSLNITLPAQSTVLRANATNLSGGTTIYTWRKVHGAGAVTFSPNGTTASVNTAIQIEPIPGHYLFEVLMTDSHGLTELTATVPVTLYNSSGTLPPNAPPLADAQQVTLPRATAVPLTLTGSDPEGYELVFLVTTPPLHGSLAGSSPDLIYTPNGTYTGADSFTFEAMDSEGQKTSATVNLTISATPPNLAIYEPFDYPAGALNGQGGLSEVGLASTWNAHATATVVAGSLSNGALPVAGGSIGGLSGGSNNFGGARAVSASALLDKGLLADDATLWFSVMMGYDAGGNVTNSRLAFALANSQFSSSNLTYNILDEGPQFGSGLGVTLGRFGSSNGYTVATQFRNSTTGSGFAGNLFGTLPGTTYPNSGQYGLIVGKIVWGATSDTIELFRPDANLNLGPTISTLTVSVNQSTFDTITWARGDKVLMDEIRFGASYASVLFGTTSDIIPPTLANSAIVDDQKGLPISINTLVTYTVTFSEDMDTTTVSATDFGNAGTAAISIGTILESSPGVFTIRVTPTSVGTLQLKVNAGAVLKDVEANALITTSPIADDTTLGINVADAYAAWAGAAAFAADANNDGVANGMAWLLGATDPSTTASGLLPKPSNESGKLVLTFRCLKTANRGSAVLRVQYTNDLGQADPWTSHQALVPDADGTVGSVVFDTTADADPAFINVRAEIPTSAASPAGKLFGRLLATGLEN